MKVATVLAHIMVCLILLGCGEDKPAVPVVDKGQVNRSLIQTYNDMAIQNAIISQHTLYPYHFVANAAELNSLGQRDLGVLAAHFKEHPGKLNVRRNDVDLDVYEARVRHVQQQLQAAGVETSRITVSDGMPGGTGMLSERVIDILATGREPLGSMGTGTTTTSGRTTGAVR